MKIKNGCGSNGVQQDKYKWENTYMYVWQMDQCTFSPFFNYS